MKYEIGQCFYKRNRQTNQYEPIYVEDILYKLDTHVRNKQYFTEEDIQELIEDKTLYDNEKELKETAIKEIEERFNIKLKEI